MPLSIFYWILMLLWLVLGLYRGFGPNGDRWYGAGSILLFCILLTLGWAQFGGPIQGR
jgi:hypothetical protein